MAKIAIVVSEFNKHITEKMLETALKVAKENDIQIIKKVFVPGAYDMPLVVKKLAKKEEVQAIVCLGAIVKGETAHDKIIAQSLAKTLMEIAVEFEKPITLGVIGPDATEKQAKKRAGEYATRAVLAAKKMLNALES
ncbi:MAG: 6,7-dimethyl-8-ribityllumazine synthase [Candidatus Micrarchaeota archaeon]|nr:6,7-dimethyl-8-ribityllumazine synthase [Candidatus Micrarchaeota archaeon]